MPVAVPSALRTLVLSVPHGKQVIYFDQGYDVDSLLAEYDKALIVADERVDDLTQASHFYSALQSTGKIVGKVTISINNYTKNTELMLQVLDAMQRHGLSRKSLLISVGGGATADLVGVTASVYMRGIDYATIPTSFISMADGIIGKVAVNHRDTKNMIGAFRSPVWVIVDPGFVDMSDDVRIAHGLVEVWKHGLVENDPEITDKIRRLMCDDSNDMALLWELCRDSMHTKAKYVLDDWHDKTGRHKALSLGHTLANYLEMKDELHHAEAVYYGILLEAIMAKNKGLLNPQEFDAIFDTARLFEDRFQKIERIIPLLQHQSLINSLKNDKISHNGKILFVLPTNTGYVVEHVTTDELQKAIDQFSRLRLGINL